MSDAAPLRLPRPLAYAERHDEVDTALDRIGKRVAGRVVAAGAGLRGIGRRRILRLVRAHEAAFAAMSDPDLQTATRALGGALRAGLNGHDLPARLVGRSFALVREAAGRTLGLRPHDVQLMGAYAMIEGMVAEMRTGEGKTLTASLTAATVALSGRQVHVMTVNDYLVQRDRDTLDPLYRFLGLSTSCLLEGQSDEDRRVLHRAQIVFGTNKSFAFDYLRDREVLRERPGNLRRKFETLTHDPVGQTLRLRGLQFALIDEADSVLIDEARTPLIISGQVDALPGQEPALFATAMTAAREMVEGDDFEIPRHVRRIDLTKAGLDRLDDLGQAAGGSFAVPVIREHAVTQALSALHLQHRGEAYIVKDGKILIVDENTGRTMADRSWSDGLHQMIELKEGLELSPLRRTLARITYQRYFRRYGRLAGMTGTARDSAWELWSVYRLRVARIPTHRRDLRRDRPDRIHPTAAAKWQAMADRVEALHEKGIPVLIGTRSITASFDASAALTARGLPHKVLSAAQDADEAEIIAAAGHCGAITVATSMAGRGTDIKLAPGVAELGGLHVLLTDRHDSRRVDRQLLGRAGRQGDPGMGEAILSLEDELLSGPAATRLRRLASVLTRVLGPAAARPLIRLRQRHVEALHAQIRRDLMDSDRDLNRLLAISGDIE